MATQATPGVSMGGISDVSGGGLPSGGMETELGNLLGEAFDAASGGEPAEVPAGEGGHETVPVEQSVEVPAGEGATEPAPQQAAPAATETGYALTPDGASYMVPKAELPALQSARAFQEAVGQWFSTPAEAQAAYQQSADLRTMANDWMYGSDEAIQGVLNHWAGANHADNPAARARFQQSFVRMASLMPNTLKQISPQAYEALIGAPARFLKTGVDAQGKPQYQQISQASGLILSVVEAQYARAAQTGNPADFEAAQNLDYAVTGQYKTELPQVNPQATAQSQFEQERAAFQRNQQVALNRDAETFNRNYVEGAKLSALDAEIGKLLAPIKGRFSEAAYADIVEGVKRDLGIVPGRIGGELASRMPEWVLEHEQNFHQLINDYRTTWQNGNPGAGLQARIKAYQADFLSKAGRLLPSIIQKRLGTKTAQVRAQNGQFQPAKPAAQTPQTAQPTPSANGQPQGRISKDQWDREWDSTWKAASQASS